MEVISPETVGDASATGYFFAQAINKTLNIPVGLVMANKGGTRVEVGSTEIIWEKIRQNLLTQWLHDKEISIRLLTSHSYGINGTFSPILNTP